MLKNYVTTALRNVRRHKGYAFINVAGLAVGITCCLLIGLYVLHERSYDRFHEKADRIYRLTYEHRLGADLPPAAPHEHKVWGSAAIAPLLEADFPEVEHAVRLSGRHQVLLGRDERSFQEERYFFADPAFFDVFSFPLLRGDPETALARPNTVVLTERAARRYFGAEDPLGHMLRLGSDEPGVQLEVTGIMADIPPNSHLDFDLLFSMATFEQEVRANDQDYKFDSWEYIDFFTYVLLEEGASAEALQGQFPAFVQRHAGDAFRDPPQSYSLQLEPLRAAYHSPAGRVQPLQPGPKGNAANLYLFSFIGVFILAIACFNFMNLATARSVSRAKEVGVRKTVGARREGLIAQFLLEAIVLTAVATGLALLLAELALPLFRTLAGKDISSQPLADPRLYAVLGLAVVVVGLLAGTYPALVLSRFRPSQVLKGSFAASSSGTALRKGLVVLQFATAIALIGGTLVVRAQLHYLQARPLGFDEAQQLVLDFGHDPLVNAEIETIKRELAAHPAVRSAAATRSVPGGYFPGATTQVEAPDGEMREVMPGLYEVDHDFLLQLGVEVVAGRLFSRAFATDAEEALILNAAAAQELGYADPGEAVGKRFSQWGREGEIVGVVRDFNYESLHHDIRPLTFRVSPWLRYIVLQVAAEDAAEVVADVQARWNVLVPHRPFLYSFLDRSFDALYRDDERFGDLFGTFAALAIFVACLGLFGLAAYFAQQRTKEIGIRKVLGAGVAGLVALLVKDFVLLVLVGFALATPLAYAVMHHWLDDFAYRIEMGPGVFLLAGALALAVALLTVGAHALRAALADPVEALRYE